MKITVILCTYNRCESLVKALESAAALKLAQSVEWEVLVVDNNSRDRTREVAEEFCQQYPGRFRYLFEPQQGKSYALNTGIREARGDVLAFMDDDVTVESTWLQNLTAHLHDGVWAGSGGRIVPAHAFAVPPWLPLVGPYNMGGMLALFDLGDQACALDQPPFGTNMAFQKRVFDKYGGFRTDLGPSPGSEIRSEDTEFGRRVLAGGERLWYEPSAVVYHAVPANRLTKKYLLSFWFDHGRALVREAGERPHIWWIPRRYLSILKMAVLLVGRTLRWMLTWKPQTRFYNRGWVWMTAGEIVEVYRRSSDVQGTGKQSNSGEQPRRPAAERSTPLIGEHEDLPSSCAHTTAAKAWRKRWRALLPLGFPTPVEWEVLVVDNNSSDKTREVVDDFRRRDPKHFRYCLNHGRENRMPSTAGIREAQGGVLAFMDDDVTVEPTWLENLTSPLATASGRERVGDSARKIFLPPPLASDQGTIMRWPHLPCSTAAPTRANSLSPRLVPIWLFIRECLKSMADLEPTWALVPAVRFAVRIRSLVADCSLRESGCVTNRLPLSSTRCHKAAQ